MLLILKIIGIILLIAVLLVIIVAAVVLFVPIRYSGSGSYKDEARPQLELNATWILKILRARAAYADGLHYEVSVFGRRILSSESSSGTTESAEVKQAEASEVSGAAEPAAVDDELRDGHKEALDGQKESPDKENTGMQTLDTVPDSGTVSWYDAIRSQIAKMVGDIKARADAAAKFVEDLCGKADRLAAFLNDEGNKRAFKLLWGSLKQLLAHIGPKKLKGHAILGFDDPSMTGYALAALSQLPVTWGRGSAKKKSFEVIPMFDRKAMDVEADFSGRLKIIVPARIGLKIWFNKDFKKLYAEVTDGRK